MHSKYLGVLAVLLAAVAIFTCILHWPSPAGIAICALTLSCLLALYLLRRTQGSHSHAIEWPVTSRWRLAVTALLIALWSVLRMTGGASDIRSQVVVMAVGSGAIVLVAILLARRYRS